MQERDFSEVKEQINKGLHNSVAVVKFIGTNRIKSVTDILEKSLACMDDIIEGKIESVPDDLAKELVQVCNTLIHQVVLNQLDDESRVFVECCILLLDNFSQLVDNNELNKSLQSLITLTDLHRSLLSLLLETKLILKIARQFNSSFCPIDNISKIYLDAICEDVKNDISPNRR